MFESSTVEAEIPLARGGCRVASNVPKAPSKQADSIWLFPDIGGPVVGVIIIVAHYLGVCIGPLIFGNSNMHIHI